MPKKIFIYSLIWFFGAAGSYAAEKPEPLQHQKQMKEDIQIINLLNALDLNKEQMEFILHQAQAAKAARGEALNTISNNNAAINEAFSSIKREVQDGKVAVQKESVSQFRSLNKQIEEATARADAEIESLAGAVERRLEQFQLLALDAYKPCVVPIMRQGRIGQADSAGGIAKVLVNVKSSSDARYDKIKFRLSDKILKKVKFYRVKEGDIDEAKAREMIFAAFAQVRAMDKVDFELKKDQIAKQLQDEVMPKKEISRQQKIRKFLLSENIISILEERIAKR